MNPHNPYAAPGTDTLGPPQGGDGDGERYVPLASRALLASVAVCAETFFGVVMHLGQLSMVGHAGSRAADGGTLIIGLAGLGLLITLIASVILVGVWIHRAASNLRPLGRYGMSFSPASCVGSFFIPVASLWMPLQGMREIWRASDPNANQAEWIFAPTSPLLSVWWAAWISSQLVAWGAFLAKGDPVSAGAIGLASDAFKVAAATALVLLMRRIGARQAQAASRLP